MPTNVVITEAEREELEAGGGLKPDTAKDRARAYKQFVSYVEAESDKKVDELIASDDGVTELGKLFSTYFFTLRVPGKKADDELLWPKKGYAEKIKSHVKLSMIEHHRLDLTDPVRFPEFSQKFNAFLAKLVTVGRSETDHHSEVDPVTMESIYKLLFHVKNALQARGTPEEEEKLALVPVKLHLKLHRVVQWGAVFVLMLFEARRGGEGMAFLKKEDFEIYDDPIKKFKSIKHVKSELDKNHALGTSSSLYGRIPFIDFTNNFNPGEYFSFYLSLLPSVPGGFLFPTSRQPSGKFDLMDPDQRMFEINQKVGKNQIYKMLPSLCDAVDRPKQTNHCVRATSILYMRRAGLAWTTIMKITGHQSVETIIKYYDRCLEAQGLAEVATAIGEGPRVALGQDPTKVQLETRSDVALVKFGDNNALVKFGDNNLAPVDDLGMDDQDFPISLAGEGPSAKAPRVDEYQQLTHSKKTVMVSGPPQVARNFMTGSRDQIMTHLFTTPVAAPTSHMDNMMSSTGLMLGNVAKGVMEGMAPIVTSMLATYNQQQLEIHETLTTKKQAGGD